MGNMQKKLSFSKADIVSVILVKKGLDNDVY